MKVESITFGIVAVFLLIVTPVYFLMTKEPVGSVALLLTFCLTGMITMFLAITARKMDARPEVRKDGEITEGAGELGFFPPRSIWPLFCALVLSMFALGPVFGWWLMLLGVALGAVVLTGWIYEFYRGHHAH